MADCCAVVDLRQYTVYPGRRDRLIEVFDSSLVEGQEAEGMHIVGQFRDLDHPDRYVWLRGFPELATRGRALTNFYSGPVWKEHGGAANETMQDSDDALLLTPVRLGSGYPALDAPRAPIGATEEPRSVVAGSVYHRVSADDGFVGFFTAEVLPVLSDAGAEVVASFETLAVENNFPALPLRAETVLVWFARFPDDAAYDDHRRRLGASAAWREKVLPELDRLSAVPAQQLRLRPTARSQFR